MVFFEDVDPDEAAFDPSAVLLSKDACSSRESIAIFEFTREVPIEIRPVLGARSPHSRRRKVLQGSVPYVGAGRIEEVSRGSSSLEGFKK